MLSPPPSDKVDPGRVHVARAIERGHHLCKDDVLAVRPGNPSKYFRSLVQGLGVEFGVHN